jgi:hypothetical protein
VARGELLVGLAEFAAARCLPHHLVDGAVRAHAATVQQHHAIARPDLIDQVGGPKHGQVPLLAQTMDVLDDVAAAVDVEPDGGLVQHQQPRVVQERAGDLEPPLHPAAQRADLGGPAVGEVEPGQHLRDALAGQSTAQPVERAGVAQVLLDAEVDVERRPLEHHPHGSQRGARLAAQVVAADRDAALLGREQAGDQGHQRRLAGAVGPEQGREPARRHGEAHLVEGARLARVAEADPANLQRLTAHAPITLRCVPLRAGPPPPRDSGRR